MNSAFWMLILFATVLTCRCDEEANEKSAQERKDIMRINIKDDVVTKRQTGQEGTLGLNQHYQYGASPGHYVIKSAKNDDSEFTYDYLNAYKKLPANQIYKAESEPKPAYQQYVIQRNPRFYARPALKEQKVVKVDPSQNNEQQQLYIDDKYYLQQAYQQARVPLVLRQSQAVKASPVQGIYTSQGYLPINDGPALQEARVHAALSVADNKQSAYASNIQSAYKHSQLHQSAFPDSSFEKELAELVAANQAIELKERPQQLNYYQYSPQSTQQISQTSLSPKKLPQIKISKPAPSYNAPIPLARSKTPAPHQYLIETSRPQEALQSRPVPQKTQPQYVQYYPSEDNLYSEYQPVEQKSALKVVSAPRLQTSQPPVQYEAISQRQAQNVAPSYIKYYQSIKPQPAEVEAPKEVKIGSFYPKYNVPKPQPQPLQANTDDQTQYVLQYRPQPKPEEPSANYVRYEASKPQLVEYSGENEAYLQAILAQALARKQSQEISQKSIQIQPKKSQTTSEEPRSSIYVSKSIAPKKAEQSVKILNPSTTESTEEVQTVRLPPPKNNKVYTQDEFQALLAAGYSVTPVPVTDDEGTPAKFNPPPPNYPGHSNFPVQYVNENPQQYYEKVNSEPFSASTSAPQTQVIRKRKQRRPTSPPQYRYSQETVQGVSETQTQLKYSLPLDTQESINYGSRKQPKERSVGSS